VSLENIQRSTNLQRVAAAQTSASNDPSQWIHDGRDTLIKGAELAAAGRTLGMSEEETLAAVSRQQRRQRQREAYATREQRQREWSQKRASLGNWDGEAEIKGVGYKGEDDVAFAFGEDVAYNSESGSTRADDEQSYRADDTGFTEDEETGLVRRSNFEETRALDVGEKRVPAYRKRPNPGGRTESRMVPTTVYTGDRIYDGSATTAPTSVMRDALSRLEAGRDEVGYDAMPGGADTAGRLERDIQGDPGADASLGRELARRDSQRFDPETEEANYYRAETDALAERRRLYGPGGYGARADGNIARIGEIHSIGKVYEDAAEVRSANDAIRGQITQRQDGVYLDPATGNPVSVQGPQLPGVMSGDRTPNNTGTADNLNAPQTAREWVTSAFDQTLQGLEEPGRRSDNIPQVDISSATANFANKTRDLYRKLGLEQTAVIPENIRSVDELQRVVDRVVGASGAGLTMPDPERPGRSIPAGRNSVDGVMNALNMTIGEQREFGQAMYQLDAAKRSSVNQNPTGTYLNRQNPKNPKGVTFGAGQETQVARIPKGSTIGVRVEGSDKPQRRSIVTQLSQLEGEDAQRPFFGQVEGEKPRVNRMNRTGQSDGAGAAIAVRQQAEQRARGKQVDAGRTRENQVKAYVAQERENRDAAARKQKQSNIAAGIGSPPTQSKVYGDGSMQRQVEDDARRQSEDMQLSELIRGIRNRRSR